MSESVPPALHLTPHARRVLVIGGGITGLSAAHRLLELAQERDLPLELLLAEASDRLGGTIHSSNRDGFLLEAGPDSFITDKPWALALCRRLGLEGQLIGTNPQQRRSFVVRGNRLVPVPDGFHLMAPSQTLPFLRSPILSVPGKLRVMLEGLVPPRPSVGDESLASFVTRRFGQELLERIAQPMIAGIYGADPHRLSLQATFPRFLEMEQQYGSVIRGLYARRRAAEVAPPNAAGRSNTSGKTASPLGSQLTAETGRVKPSTRGVSGPRYGLFVSLRDGMQTLVDALRARLPAACIRLGTQVTRLSRGSDGGWEAALTSGSSTEPEYWQAGAVCIALPAYRAAALLQELDPELAAELSAIPYASSATLNLAFRREDIHYPLDGFGFVTPAVEKRFVLGCTFSSVKFAGRAPEGHVLLRAFLGERGMEGRDEADLTAVVLAELGEILGITAPPLFTSFWRHERAMAQYHVGHLDRVAAIEAAASKHPGLALAGNAYRGIGIPDCVHSGEQAVERLLID